MVLSFIANFHPRTLLCAFQVQKNYLFVFFTYRYRKSHNSAIACRIARGCHSGSCCRSICDRGQTLSQWSRPQNNSYSGSRVKTIQKVRNPQSKTVCSYYQVDRIIRNSQKVRISKKVLQSSNRHFAVIIMIFL